jgi:MtrB/PioB family decaheme-associated outer membrane protein
MRSATPALLLAAIAAVVALAGSARAETDVGGGALLSGEVETGGKFLTGNFGSSEFQEYQDQRPGYFGQGNLLLELKDRLDYLGFDYQYTGSLDQTYGVRLGRWGVWGLNVQFMEFPVDYSNTGRSLYVGTGSRYLLAPPLQTQLQAAPTAAADAAILSAALFNAPGVDLQTMYRSGQSELHYRLTDTIQARIGYDVQHREGSQPLGLGFGSPGGNFSNFAGQVDDWTHTARAGIDFANHSWNLSFDYFGSFYENNVPQLTVANPLRATDDLTAGSSLGRISTPPSNQSNTFSLTGGWKIPLEIPTRITGTFSYGQLTQDQNFLPYTINTAINAANATTLVLPKQNLGGLVDTYLGNLVLTSQLTDDLDAKIRYRYYDYNNRTPSLTFPAEVVNDASFTPGTITSITNAYERQTLSSDFTYRLIRALSMTLGYEWDYWKRSADRERTYQNTQTGTLSANFRPDPHVQIRATYALSARNGTDYNPIAPLQATLPADEVATAALTGQLAQLRKFDEANYWRSQASLLAQFMLTEELDATLSAGFGHNNYDQSSYGLENWQDWNAGIDLAYRPLDWLGLRAGYEYQQIQADQKDRLRNVSGGVAIDDPINDWMSPWNAQMQNASAGFDITIVRDLLDVHFTYGYQYSRDRTRTNSIPGGPFLVALSYPTDSNTLQFLTTRIDYHVTKMLTLRAAWRWERFDLNNFRRNSSFAAFNAASNVNTMTGAISPSTMVFLGDQIGDYNVNIVGFSAVLKF